MYNALNLRRKQLRNRKSAFTLVEIMIVVLIIGILLAIAVPNFVHARETARSKACIENMKQIASAEEQYAMDQKLATGATAPLMTVLVGPTAYIKSTPVCPSAGAYTINAIGTDPVCGIGVNTPATYAPHIIP